MKNKKVMFIILFLLVLCIIAIILAASIKKNSTFEDYTEYVEEPDMEAMLNEDLIPVHERNAIEKYILENKDELVSKGVPVEFFENISITMHNSSSYTIITGDKVIAIGLNTEGGVEYCNVY